MSGKQTTLPLVSDATLPDAPQTAIAVVADMPRESRALADLRQAAFSMPVPLLKQALAEYDEQRETIRDFLLSKMQEGTHYAYPPNLEPKYDEHGNMKVWNKQKNAFDLVNPKNWRPKQSLYKAGGEMVCDLMGVRCEFSADVDAWQQLGSPKETFVMICRLHSRATGELLGEGRGVRKVGQKGGDANNAIKMAQKCAMVDAVLTTYGLSDLFTQDIEDEPQPPHDNPTPREDAPKVKPRGERNGVRDTLSVGMLKGLYCDFIGLNRDNATEEAIADAAYNWRRFKAEVLGKDVADKAMTDEQVRECHVALEKMETERRNART